jgi:NAD(P)H-dependent FMN reductase
MEQKIRIKIIIGSTRQNRFSEKPADWIYSELQKKKEVEVELLDLKDYPMPFFNEPMPPAMNGGVYADPAVQKWADKIKDGDAFIVVSPEYNHGYPAVLKNALDVLFAEWNNKAIGFVSYGSAHGARAVEQLRQVVIELRMVPISRSVHIPWDIYMQVANEKSKVNPELFAPLRKGMRGDQVGMFFDQLVWMGNTLKKAREAEQEQRH